MTELNETEVQVLLEALLVNPEQRRYRQTRQAFPTHRVHPLKHAKFNYSQTQSSRRLRWCG